MKRKFSTKRNEKGQGLVEYALISVLAGLVVIGVLMAFDSEIKDIIYSVSGGMSVQDGVLYIPDLSPTLTPTASSVPTDLPTPTNTLVPTDTPIPTDTPAPTITPAPTELACTPGSATDVRRLNVCTSLRDINHCESYSYNFWSHTCSWH